MAEETIVYLSLIVRVIKDSPPEDTQNCSPPHKPSHRSSWVSLCDWAVDPFVPRPLWCTDYTYIFFFSVSMEVHIILFSLFFLSISFLSRSFNCRKFFALDALDFTLFFIVLWLIIFQVLHTWKAQVGNYWSMNMYWGKLVF